MRSYKINTDKLVNQLTPHYMGGRKMVLFLQSLIYPLQSISDAWGKWTQEISQEAAVTSQVIILEHFLNQRLSQYFINADEKIQIVDTDIDGVVMYWESVRTQREHLPMRTESEHSTDTPCFYAEHERQKYTGISFIVQCPAIDTSKIDLTTVTDLITKFVSRYSLAGKLFKIQYNE